MISYKPFWNMLKRKNITSYSLITDYKFSSSTIDRLRRDKPITTVTIDKICKLLGCGVDDVILYVVD